MKKSILVIFLAAVTTAILSSCSDESSKYMGQEPPGLTPKIFAPDVISTKDGYEFGSAFSKKADKFFYAVRLNKDWKAEIRYTELQNGKWTNPKRLELNEKYTFNDPLFSDDESKLYFISNRPLSGQGEPKDFDLWYIQKNETGWSEPISVGKSVNSAKNEFYISFSNAGTIYFATNTHTISKEDEWDYDIYYSKTENGKFQTPVRLGREINSEDFECDAFVSPDESYMIFCSSRSGGHGEGDLYISFKDDKNNWTKAKNMGNVINTDTHEFCPFVTKDGKYFFYTSNGDIHWVSSKIIENMKVK